ncbi:MAG: ABC transporter ATP-binding protein [Actinomycetes bacterium]
MSREPESNAVSAVEVEHLRVVRRGNVVLPDVSFRLAVGSVTGLLGPSGCGKTTLIRSIVGVQIVAGGAVTVLGEPAGTAALRHRVGYVTQAPSVYADLTVRQNLQYFAAVIGAADERIDDVLREVDLTNRADRLVGRLSGGESARVSLATALLGRPELLVLDEPTVGLDPVLRQDLWQLFHRLARAGTTLLVSSHVMEEAARCDRLLLMREGVVIADTTPDELRTRTGVHDLADAFLQLVQEPVG